MKKTLLEIVKHMLTTIEGERVNSVGDTEESLMCVDIANSSYEEMMVHKKWKHLRDVSVLETSTGLNELKAPAGTISVDPHNLYYNKSLITWVEPDVFLSRTESRDETNSNVSVISGFKIYTDRNPSYVTSDDDEILTFDAVPSAINGLDASKSKALIYKMSENELVSDTDIFDMPAALFPALLSLCKYYAALDIKGDESLADRHFRQYTRKLASLVRTGKFVDVKTDIRNNIIARQTRGGTTPRQISTTT